MIKADAKSSPTTTTGNPPEVRLELTSNPLFLSGARELVAAIARRLGFSEEACGQVSLAVDEALCNVIRHGYGRELGRPIWISLWPIYPSNGQGSTGTAYDGPAHALRIVVEDEARQVDPATIKSRDLDQIRPGGLGVHIIHAVMDDVRYERREPVGMRLIMIKNRNSQAVTPTGMDSCCGGIGCDTQDPDSARPTPARGIGHG